MVYSPEPFTADDVAQAAEDVATTVINEANALHNGVQFDVRCDFSSDRNLIEVATLTQLCRTHFEKGTTRHLREVLVMLMKSHKFLEGRWDVA